MLKHINLKLTLLVWSLCLPIFGFAQDATLINKILAANNKLSTIEATFKQVKQMVMLDSEIKSEGTLYFQRTNKLSMIYTRPANDILVINSDNFAIRSAGKITNVNTKNNEQMRLLRNTLLYCLQCDINAIAKETNANIAQKESATHYIFTLTSKNKAQIGYNKIELSINKKTLLLEILRMDETNGNYTVYNMSDIKTGKVIDVSKFSIPKK